MQKTNMELLFEPWMAMDKDKFVSRPMQVELCQVKAETPVDITSKTPAAKALDILGRMQIAIVWSCLTWQE